MVHTMKEPGKMIICGVMDDYLRLSLTMKDKFPMEWLMAKALSKMLFLFILVNGDVIKNMEKESKHLNKQELISKENL